VKKLIEITVSLIILFTFIGCNYFPPRTVGDGEERLIKLVDDYITECGTVKPFGTEKYEDFEDNAELAKINEDYLARSRELLKQIEAINAGDNGDELKSLRTNAALFAEILETRSEAFSTVDPELSTIEQALYSARFAVLIEVANDEMRQLQANLD
jgi:hypothetical protein